jgi:hypothetical protein
MDSLRANALRHDKESGKKGKHGQGYLCWKVCVTFCLYVEASGMFNDINLHQDFKFQRVRNQNDTCGDGIALCSSETRLRIWAKIRT